MAMQSLLPMERKIQPILPRNGGAGMLGPPQPATPTPLPNDIPTGPQAPVGMTKPPEAFGKSPVMPGPPQMVDPTPDSNGLASAMQTFSKGTAPDTTPGTVVNPYGAPGASDSLPAPTPTPVVTNGNTGIVPPAVTGSGNPATPTSTPGTQDQATAGSVQGYTPTMPNNAANVGAVNGIDAVRVNPTSMDGYQPFIDQAYGRATSRLDPQFQQMERQFQQDMVNKGIAPGTEAFDNARANFDRAKNDAYAGARQDAMGQGLAAQGQAFGQGAQQTQLAQAMRQWMDQFGLNRDQLDLSAQGQLVGQDMDAYRLNQATQLQDFQLAQALLGMIPASGPSQIDVNGAYGLSQSANQANYGANQNSNNALWGAIGQLGSAWLNSRGG